MYRLRLFEEELKIYGKACLQVAGITFVSILVSYFLDFLCKCLDRFITPNKEIPIFVISLDKDRLDFFDSQLSDYSQFDAVDWREISVIEDDPVFDRDPKRMTVSYFVKAKSDTTKYVAECLRYPGTKLRLRKKYFRKNDIGCLFSHLALWNECYKQAYDKILVFEDDVVLKPFFKTKLKMFLRKIPQDFDIAFLGYRDNFKQARLLRIGMHAYVVNLQRKSLRNFMSNFYCILPIDYMVWIASANLNCYFNDKHIAAINEEFKSHEEFDVDYVASEDLDEYEKEINKFFDNQFS